MNWNRRKGFGPNRRDKLYRNGEDGVIAGVCAGVADYFGFDLTFTRVVTVVCGFFFGLFVFVLYIVLALVLEKKPKGREGPRRRDDPDVELERRVRAEPHTTLHSVRHRFRDLDQRLQRLEKYVTSDRFKLDREFEGLKG